MLRRIYNLTRNTLINKNNFFRFSTIQNNQQEQQLQQIENFSYLVRKFEDISQISSRNGRIQIVEDIITSYLQHHNRDLFFAMIKLLTCKVDSEEIQIAHVSLEEILQEVFPEQNIQQFLFEKGDIGLFAKEMLGRKMDNNNQQIQQISLLELINFFEKLKNLSGDGSRLEKSELIVQYLQNLTDPLEIQYFIRILSRSLRIGVNDKSIIKALTNLKKKNEQTDLDSIIQQIQQNIFKYNIGITSQIIPGQPIPPMLAKPISDYDQLNKFLTKFTSKRVSLELKYDGERSQVHYNKEIGVRLFSRNLESQNEKYPQLVKDLKKYFDENNINDCILDGEIITLDEQGNIRSFQEQQQNRKRKFDSSATIQSYQNDLNKNQVDGDEVNHIEKIYLFDVILSNSNNMIQQNQQIRKDILKQYYPVNGPVDHAESKILDLNIEEELNELKSIITDYINKKYEGAMVKSLDEKTFYDNNGRTQWAKIKKQILTGGVADTLDVLPIAAYYGKGKRSGVFGAYLLGCYDEQTGQYIALCKIGTGFSDKFMQESTERLRLKEVQSKPKEYIVHRNFKPDVWLDKDSEVWEVESDSFSLSPIYTIGQELFNDKGISLRFPRFINVRLDKNAKTSTTISQVIELYQQQVSSGNQSKKQEQDNEEDDGFEEKQ